MQTTVHLEIPSDVSAKLFTNEYKRVGGVIQDDRGKVVMWLREGNLRPTSPNSLISQLPPKIGSLLNIAGQAASVLNLGATIAFGAATLSKLGKIDRKLDGISEKLDEMDEKLDVIIEKLEEIEQKIDQVQWSIDVGFANTMQSLESLRQYQEIGLAGELSSATNLAWSCQFLEPNSTQRTMRIEQALAKSSRVTETLLIHTENEMKSAIDCMESKRKNSSDFKIDDLVISALHRFRQTCLACSVNANIQAEAGDIYSVGIKLKKDKERLFKLVYQLANLSIASNDGASYRVLLDEQMSEMMPMTRINLWIERFDHVDGSLLNVLERLRKVGFGNTLVTKTDRRPDHFIQQLAFNAFDTPKKKKKIKSKNKNTSAFFNLIDGIYEDLDRLEGEALEYKTMDSMGLSIHEYRDSLIIDHVENSGLVFISLDDVKKISSKQNTRELEMSV